MLRMTVAGVHQVGGEDAVVVVGVKESPSATDVTGPVTSHANVLKTTRVTENLVEAEEVEGLPLSVIVVTGLATSLENVLRAMVPVVVKSVVAVVDVAEVMVAVMLEGVVASGATSVVEAVAQSATSATGLVTSLGSAARRRTAATSAMALGTSRGTAVKTRTPATTATRSGTS